MQTVGPLAAEARVASRALAAMSSDRKDAVLRAWADALESRATEILAANSLDLAAARANGTAESLVDRLCLARRGRLCQGLSVHARGKRLVTPDPNTHAAKKPLIRTVEDLRRVAGWRVCCAELVWAFYWRRRACAVLPPPSPCSISTSGPISRPGHAFEFHESDRHQGERRRFRFRRDARSSKCWPEVRAMTSSCPMARPCAASSRPGSFGRSTRRGFRTSRRRTRPFSRAPGKA